MTEGPQRPGEDPEDETRVRGLPPESSASSDDPESSDASSGDAFADAWPRDEDAPEATDAETDSETGAEAREADEELPADVAPAAEAQALEEVAEPAPPVEEPAPSVVVRRGGGRGIAIIALILVLLVLGSIGGTVGYFVYQGEDPLDYVPIPTIERLEARLDELQTEVSAAERTGRRALDRESELRDGLDDLGRALTALSSDIAAEAPIDERQWRLAETAYLLRVANIRAGLEKDRAGADALLVAADELLRELDDLGLMPVRERIAEARTSLRTSPAVDRTGLYLELEALGEQIAALPMDQREYAPPPRDETPTEEQLLEETDEVEPAGWTGTLRETVAGLVDFRIHRPSPVRTLSEPGEADFVRHNLALKIEQAQLALLRKDAEVWRLALEDAARWTRDYFDLESTSVRAVLADLERLTEERVEVPAPDLSAPHEELLRLRSRASFLGGGRRSGS